LSPVPAADSRELRLPAGDVELAGDLAIPADAQGLVLFVHGSGSSRFSRRNRFVAHKLQEYGLATLLFDLLSEAEERIDRRDASYRFDIPLLARRTVAVIDGLEQEPGLDTVPLGLFGASTGAAAALIAAAERPRRVSAVVSRGGRPDLAAEALPAVVCPTLLIVGGHDPEVLRLNREAAARLRAPHELRIVPGATHLFEEPGTLEQVAELAGQWLARHCVTGR
jgi:pimeloyl-ACP methyl ester carboxylesterase